MRDIDIPFEIKTELSQSLERDSSKIIKNWNVNIAKIYFSKSSMDFIFSNGKLDGLSPLIQFFSISFTFDLKIILIIPYDIMEKSKLASNISDIFIRSKTYVSIDPIGREIKSKITENKKNININKDKNMKK